MWFIGFSNAALKSGCELCRLLQLPERLQEMCMEGSPAVAKAAATALLGMLPSERAAAAAGQLADDLLTRLKVCVRAKLLLLLLLLHLAGTDRCRLRCAEGAWAPHCCAVPSKTPSIPL
jgi:hypothetical protein